jgi:hypothetical protein
MVIIFQLSLEAIIKPDIKTPVLWPENGFDKKPKQHVRSTAGVIHMLSSIQRGYSDAVCNVGMQLWCQTVVVVWGMKRSEESAVWLQLNRIWYTLYCM